MPARSSTYSRCINGGASPPDTLSVTFIGHSSLEPISKMGTAFGRRCIPPGCVARRSHMADILPPRALPAGRLAGLGAAPPFLRWVLARGAGGDGAQFRDDLSDFSFSGALPKEVATPCNCCVRIEPDAATTNRANSRLARRARRQQRRHRRHFERSDDRHVCPVLVASHF